MKDIPGIKQLKGHPSAYRYRKGNYRIGFYFEEGTIILAAFDNRGENLQAVSKVIEKVHKVKVQ